MLRRPAAALALTTALVVVPAGPAVAQQEPTPGPLLPLPQPTQTSEPSPEPTREAAPSPTPQRTRAVQPRTARTTTAQVTAAPSPTPSPTPEAVRAAPTAAVVESPQSVGVGADTSAPAAAAGPTRSASDRLVRWALGLAGLLGLAGAAGLYWTRDAA